MITNDKQYNAAKEQLKMLKQALSSPVKKNVPPVVDAAARAQIKELIDEIQAKKV